MVAVVHWNYRFISSHITFLRALNNKSLQWCALDSHVTLLNINNNIIFGSQLIAIEKKSSRLLSITTGYTRKRIAAKCANSYAIASLSITLAECRHSRRMRSSCHKTFCRDYALELINESWNWISATHSTTYIVTCLEFISLSFIVQQTVWAVIHTSLPWEGPQQGDSLGPLQFCNTVHPLLFSLTSVLNTSFSSQVFLRGTQLCYSARTTWRME